MQRTPRIQRPFGVRTWSWLLSTVCLLVVTAATVRAEEQSTYSVGVAQVDITPDYPVRLSGFGFRRAESEGVTQAIWAKALAIADVDKGDPVVLITVDNLGIPATMRNEVAQRLAKKAGLKEAHLSIAASHSHTAPMLHNVAPTLFAGPIPDEHQQRIDRYTTELTDKLESVALAAVTNRHPSRLSWGIGSTTFAINRRTKGGPVDHDLPVLVVKNLEGQVRSILVNYACHCVTLSDNKISGDWAGYAQDLIERDFPSVTALVSIGCGADQNPSSGVMGDKSDIALKQGAEIAAEVKRMLGGFLVPVNGPISTKWKSITLDFAVPPTRAQWEEKAKKQDAEGYHARVQLGRLDRGEPLQSTLDYPISSWAFGSSLAMVFLPGEVVVDYALRLKSELDGRRLWINAYSNDAPCYIPSERVLGEGGYEAAGAMLYYDRPGPLKAGLEAKIIGAVHEQLGQSFSPPFDPKKTQGSRARSPHQSLSLLQTTSNLRVDLVVAEPLIADPVAIDFGDDGSLWVAEMLDYPTLPGPNSPPAKADEQAPRPMGQVRLVRDRDGDGQFDASTVFLDGIPFPTGVTSWKRGVLVCSAPDILYAEDTDGDDRADSVTKLFTGFGTLNMQARVNSLNDGLDGWIYGSCGLFGGTITNSRGQSFALGDRDFRFHPETLELQPATGRTQQGRVRDDFGNWFGCDNSNLGFHYPLAEHYLQRNPFIAAPANRLNVARSDESRQLFPARTDAQRFQLSGAPGSVTAACGIGVYRDSKLGAEYANNLFVCEPVNLLVHRMKLKRQGVSFEAERPDNEAGTEFLRSTDGWFRPVQVVTGPDGNLWVVDMYRFLIEDPRWIPEHELAPLDVRAGTTLGRIYRVRNRDDQSTPVAHRVPRETGKTASSDVLSLTRPNPYPVHHERTLARLAARAKSPDEQLIAAAGALRLPPTLPEDAVLRIGKYRTAEASGLLTEDNIRKALTDLHEGIRSYALQLTERHLTAESLPDEIIKTCSDPEISVRLQAACSLGHWTDQRVGPLLAELALHDADNSYVVAAVFSSVTRDNLRAFTATLFAKLKGREPPAAIMTPYLATAVGYGDDEAIKLGLAAVTVTPGQPLQAWQLQGIANLVEALSQRPDQTAIDRDVTRIIREMEDRARTLVAADDLADQTRLAAINLLGRNALQTKADTTELSRLLSSRFAPAVQVAAVEALERMGDDSVPALLAAQFSSVSPATQTRIIDALLSRDAWYPTLFTEIEAGNLPATAFNAAQRQELVGHPDEATRTRAAKLFATLVNADRQRVIQQYQEALTLRGDAERGRALFTKTCAQCHRLGEVGHAVGPNLSMVANKTPAFLLQELMDPNRNVDSRYVSYAAETKRGLVRTGILSSESTNSVTLLGPEGKQYTLLRSEIEDLRATGRSLMPEGLERDLMPQSVADIIAFLTSVPATPKVFAGNHPATVTPADKEVALLATTAAIFGDQIVYEAPFRNVGFWHGVQDHVAWSLELPERREYDVYMDYACDAGSAGNSYRIESGTESLAGRIEPTGGWDRYTVAKVGQLKLNEGKQRVVLRPDGASIRGALVDLRGLHLVPAGEPFAMALPAETAEPTTVAEIAQQIMDDNRPEATRQQLITRHPEQAAALVTAMTSDLANDEDEEYRRIPWIWRVAIACGKRNDAAQIRALLDVSVPKRNHQLRDWQAVVLGGGIINGLSLQRQWPAVRLNEIVRDDADLKQRLARCIALASQMADNDKIRTGTRYDALRIIALENEPGRRTQLTDYLLEEVNDELQMGAISGLSDIQSNDVAQLLLGHLANFNDENRGLALSALLRTDQRATELLEAIARDKALASKLSVEHRKTLRQSANAAISERAKQLLAD